MAEIQHIKLPIMMLNNPTIGRLPDRLWRRFVEFCLVAATCGNSDGTLPNEKQLAWFVRDDYSSVSTDILELIRRGLLDNDPTLLIVDYQAMQIPHLGEDWQSLWKRAIMVRDRWTCRYCGAPAEHIDHVVPRCQGGADSLDNLVAACAACNLHKGGKTPEQAGMVLDG